jgi:hypothetical protein
MDLAFAQKLTINGSQQTRMRPILIAKGKAINVTESRDVATGCWIVAIAKDQVDHFTRFLAGSAGKLFENKRTPCVEGAACP